LVWLYFAQRPFQKSHFVGTFDRRQTHLVNRVLDWLHDYQTMQPVWRFSYSLSITIQRRDSQLLDNMHQQIDRTRASNQALCCLRSVDNAQVRISFQRSTNLLGNMQESTSRKIQTPERVLSSGRWACYEALSEMREACV
jgi:hypothetical protein